MGRILMHMYIWENSCHEVESLAQGIRINVRYKLKKSKLRVVYLFWSIAVCQSQSYIYSKPALSSVVHDGIYMYVHWTSMAMTTNKAVALLCLYYLGQPQDKAVILV